MWTYKQSTGELSCRGFCATGYAGAGEGKNNPAMQGVQCVGPIPVGLYTICAPRNTKTHGPYVLPLTPHLDNDMLGRSGFLIHGDSLRAPGTASLGCIVVARAVRVRVWDSGDRLLQVVA